VLRDPATPPPPPHTPEPARTVPQPAGLPETAQVPFMVSEVARSLAFYARENEDQLRRNPKRERRGTGDRHKGRKVGDDDEKKTREENGPSRGPRSHLGRCGGRLDDG